LRQGPPRRASLAVMAPSTKRSRPAAEASKAAKKKATGGEAHATETAPSADAPARPNPGKPQGLQRWFGGCAAKDAKPGTESPSAEVLAKKPVTVMQCLFSPAGQKRIEPQGSFEQQPQQQQQQQQPQQQQLQPRPQPQESQKQSPLNEEQQRRIEENRRKALEKQRAKRGLPIEEPAKEPAREAAASPTNVASPVKLTALREAANQEAVTPEKVVLPPQERRQSPAPRNHGDNGVVTASNQLGKGKYINLGCGSWGQYHGLYCARQRQLGPVAMQEARDLWGGMVQPQNFLADLTGYRKSLECGEVVMVGILYKEMKARPSVIDQYKDVNVVGSLGESTASEAAQRLCGEDDVLWLEDTQMRVQLVTTPEQTSNLVTGIVAAVRGTATGDGKFTVNALCFGTARCPPPLPSGASEADEAAGPFLALMSGLAFGREIENPTLATSRSRALDFLLGGKQTVSQGAVQHLIICGGTLTAGLTGACLKQALKEADECLAKLACTLRVDLMPGRGEPTSVSLPQLPLHPHLFQHVRDCKDFRSFGNPYDSQVQGVSVLGHSGQPVEDILRCTGLQSPVHALATCLEASHLAPTTPDTVPTQPFVGMDPFVMEDRPHVLFSGCHDRPEHQWHSSARGQGGTIAVAVPDFQRYPAVVLVNLRNPRQVQVHAFGEEQDTESSCMAQGKVAAGKGEPESGPGGTMA